MISFSDLLTITMNPVQVILTLIVGLLVGLYVWFIYKKTFSGVMYSRTYGMTLVMMTIVTALMLMLSAVSASAICLAVICSSVCSERYSRSCLRCRVRYLAISHPSNLQLICKLVYRTVLHLSICELIANRRCSARSGTAQRAPSNDNLFPRATL